MDAERIRTFDRFLRQMRLKLAANSHKTGWLARDGCTMSVLWDKLNEERAELRDAINGDQEPQKVGYEAADVANVAMMIADHYRDLRAAADLPAKEAPK